MSDIIFPIKINSKIADFTGFDESKVNSLTDLTLFICKYIKDNNLTNSDGSRIFPDEKLSLFLGYKKDDSPLTYNRIQKYLNPMIVKLF